MSIPNLPVDFKDDILNTGVNQKRKYQQTYNSDGSVSFEDVTAYQQKGSNFGAQEVNETNGAVNNIYAERIVGLDELDLVTEPGFFVDALAVKELNDKMSSLCFVENYTSPDVTVPGNGYNDVYVPVSVIDGYNRIIWHENISNSPNGGVNESRCSIYRTEISTGEDNMRVHIRNDAASNAKVRVMIRMLYIRTDCYGRP